MAKFEVEVPHSLQTPEVRTRLEKARSKLETDYGATCTWDDEGRLRVARKGLDALVTIQEDRLHVTCELGLLMSTMMGPIKAGITKQLTELMSRPEAPPSA